MKVNHEILKKLNIISNFEFECENIGYLNHNKKNMISFLADKKYSDYVNKNYNIKFLITYNNFKKLIKRKDIKLIYSEQPQIDFISIWNSVSKQNYKTFDSIIPKNTHIHETAFIASQNVQIGENVYIGPNVNVLEDVIIGDNCKIFSGTTLGCAFIHKRVDNNVIENFHDGKLIIKNNVDIHSNCSIDKGNSLNGNTIIGENTKINHLCYIAHSSIIGKDCLLHGNLSVLGGAKIGDRVNIHPGSTIGGWVNIGNDVSVIINSVVISDIPSNSEISGHYALDSKVFMYKYFKFFDNPFKKKK